MAKIEKEQAITSYKGRLFRRLLGYARPYVGNFVIAFLLVLAVTALNLYHPTLIARAIDDHIENYGQPFAVVSERTASWNIRELTLPGISTLMPLIMTVTARSSTMANTTISSAGCSAMTSSISGTTPTASSPPLS